MQDELARTCQRTYASDQRKLDELTDQLNPLNGQTLRGGELSAAIAARMSSRFLDARFVHLSRILGEYCRDLGIGREFAAVSLG